MLLNAETLQVAGKQDMLLQATMNGTNQMSPCQLHCRYNPTADSFRASDEGNVTISPSFVNGDNR